MTTPFRYFTTWNALPQYISNELTRIEKRVISIIISDKSYNNESGILGESTIVDHIDSLYDKLFYSITSDKDHRLNSLLPLYNLPPLLIQESNIRNYRPYDIPHVRTNRAKNSFILAMACQTNQS